MDIHKSAMTHAIQVTKKRAAQIAREMGYSVRASQSKHGRVSSYYLTKPLDWPFDKQPIRISDHELPLHFERINAADPLSDPFSAEIIIRKPLRDKQIERLILLAEHGREPTQTWMIED